jgi:beta propeller repeat protein
LGANSSNSNGNFTLKTDRVPFENALLGSIYKNKIVFYTDINSENSNRDIYLYDIDNNKLSQITKDNSNQEQPYIYEDIIVWTDYRFKQVSVFMYNISTGEETKLNISVQKIGFSSIIGIYDGIICGRSYHDGVYLFFYNISSNNIEEIPVPDYYRQFYYKNKIALLTKDNKIYIYDKTTNVTIQLNNTYEKKGISIYENSVVWSDNRNGRLNFDLYYYNLQNGSEYQITNFQDTEEIEPFIFKNNIAYSRFKNSHNDDSYKSIYLYDLNTGISKKLSGEMASQPQIFENIIVWREGTPSFMKSRDIIIIRQI